MFARQIVNRYACWDCWRELDTDTMLYWIADAELLWRRWCLVGAPGTARKHGELFGLAARQACGGKGGSAGVVKAA